MKLNKYIPAIILLLVMFIPSLIHAQSPAPDPGGDPDVPIDGGLSLLLAAGVGYVAKKGYDSRKNKLKNREDALIDMEKTS
jgi:hypothetical protein